MKPKEKKPEIVFRIIDRESGEAQGSYSRAYCDEYDFNSVSEARNANCHGMFLDQNQYKIAKYKVTYELIEDDCPYDAKEERRKYLQALKDTGLTEEFERLSKKDEEDKKPTHIIKIDNNGDISFQPI